ncbi:MAG: hypothetical protein NVS3B1_21350 [Marmoricola sp.]
MTWVKLGNAHTAEAVRDENDVVQYTFTEADAPVVTNVVFPDGLSLVEQLQTIAMPGGVWSNHGSENPLWVESDNEALAQLLAQQFNCPVGAPADTPPTPTPTYPVAEPVQEPTA